MEFNGRDQTQHKQMCYIYFPRNILKPALLTTTTFFSAFCCTATGFFCTTTVESKSMKPSLSVHVLGKVIICRK